MKTKVLLALAGTGLFVLLAGSFFVSRTTGAQQPPPPPPPPPPGALGGSLVGLSAGQTSFFNIGYSDFNVKWDPIRGLGPVFTQPGCFTCHGGGVDVITNCAFNPPSVGCVAGGSSTVLGTRFGKWNSDGTFNYLDGSGTFPENEGGPALHGQSVAQFGTLQACSVMAITSAPTGATESGNTVTITTTVPHRFQVGQTAQVFSVPVAGYNGNFTILQIPKANMFTYTDSVSGLAASGGGSANNMPNETLPADATVVNKLRSTQLYGLGLIDSIPESTLTSNQSAQCANKGSTGICGTLNMVPDQNGILHVGRFGQKASVPNLLMFTALAFAREASITNAFFPVPHLPQGQPFPAACQPDTSNPEDVNGKDFLQAYQFNEMLASVAPQPPTSQTLAGKAVFENTGCNTCHTESMTTGPNIRLATDLSGGLTAVVAPLSSVQVNLYSDLLLHDMGPKLSGGIPFEPDQQGQATMTMWRTAPLWGLSTRLGLGLLHDNRTTDLKTAIVFHGGEATNTVLSYKALSPTDQANLLAFLTSL